MRAIFIGFKDILILLRDRKALISLIATPLILTFVLGTALGSLWGDDSQGGTLGTLLVFNEDHQGQFSQILLDEVYGSDEFSSRFTVEIIDDKFLGEEQVTTGKAIALVTIPEGFSSDILSGEETKVEILGDIGNEFMPPIIYSITEMFVDEVTTRIIALNTSQGFLRGEPTDAELIMALMEKVENRFKIIEISKDATYVSGHQVDTTNPINAMGYYSAAMAVMYLMFNANLGGKRILVEKEQGTLQRLKACKTSTLDFILGKTMGIYFSSLLQVLVLIGVTSTVYKVNWGNPLMVIIFAVIIVFAASGIGIFIASLATSSSGADGLGSLIVLVMAALGGSMWPLYGMPPFMRFLSNFTFNRWAVDGFVQIMSFDGGLSSISTNIITLLAIGTVTLLIATLRLNKLEVK